MTAAIVKRSYRNADGSLVAIDEVREDAARCCDETAKMELGQRTEVGTGLNGKDAEFSDAAFGVANEVALTVGRAIRMTGRRVHPSVCWSTAARLLRQGWTRGAELYGIDITDPKRPSA